MSPKTITVSAGARVTFINNDSRVHDMESDPHPEHTNCPEINQVGFMTPGQTKLTGNLNPSDTGNLVLKNTTDFAWTQCELRIPPNRVYRFPASYSLQPRLTVMIIAKHVLQDTRPPEAQVVRGAWALARCAEGTSYLAYDREQ